MAISRVEAYKLTDDHDALLAEVQRLRTDLDHAREWASYWRHNAVEDDDDADRWPEGTASDGWHIEPEVWEGDMP
jgi:hypothetical protein